MNLSLISEEFQKLFKLPLKNRLLIEKTIIKNIMRIGIVTISLLITSSVQLLFASPLKSQPIDKVEIRIGLNNETLVQAFQKIEAQSSFHFMYRNEEVKNIRNLNLPVIKKSVEEILKIVLSGTSLSYRQIDNQILIISSKNLITDAALKDVTGISLKENKFTYAPEANIVKGKVTNSKGEPLAGVSVTIKGINTGVTTDENGNYSTTAPGNGTLIFSYIDFITQEVAVNNQTIINVRLLEKNNELDKVVVTALGISREKMALPYSVTQIGGEGFTKARENNLGNALSGKIAGVNATRTATGPGGSSRVIIRGNGSLGGDNQPLYVVDGVPIDNTNLGSAGMWGGFDAGDGLSSIEPDDIESITVLKGGTAAALYGSRAANGVILITTKTGKAQKGIGIELNSTYTMETPLVYTDYQYQYGSGNFGIKPASQSDAIAYGTISWGSKLDGSLVMQPDGVARPYVAQKNNIKNFYNIGHSASNTVALNGGNESAHFRFAASNVDDNAIIPNSSTNRKTFSLDVTANLAKKVIFNSNVQYNIEAAINRPYVSDQPFNINAAPQLIATNIDIRILKPGYDAQGNEPLWHDGDANNPYFLVNKLKENDTRNRLIGSFSARYNINNYLYARGRFGTDYYNVASQWIVPTGIQQWEPNMGTNNLVSYETNAEGIVGFNKNFGRFSVDALVGGNQMHHVINGISLASGPFNVPYEYFIGNGTGQTFTKNYQEYAINSLFSSADIGYHNYLYLSLTGRKDWFSTLPIKSDNIIYPSAGLSFVFSDAWHKKPTWLNYGKIRSSWAQVGGGAPSPYALSLTYVSQPAQALGQPLQAINGSTVPNGAIKPYTSTTTEFGIELKGLNNRIGVDITLYKRETTNDIVSASVPTSSGFGSVLLNVGDVQNKGIEILLNGSPIKSKKGFTWDISFNAAYNKNTVVKIADGLTSLYLPGAESRTKDAFIYHYQGMPYGQIAGYKIKTDPKGNKVYDQASGLPVQSAFMALGSGVPPYTLGLTNTFTYRSFSFSFLLDGKFGGKLYSATNAYASEWGLAKRTADNNVRENGLTVKGVDLNGNPFTATESAQTYFQGTAKTITSDFIYDASFIKLRQFVLGYALPNSIISKTPFQSASLSLVARNLLLLYSKVPNVDPESTYNNSNAQGLEMYGVPSTRSYGINLTVRF